MTSNGRLPHIATFTVLTVLFGVASTVSAIASGSAQHQAAPVAAVASPSVQPTPSATPTVKVLRPVATAQPSTAATAKPATKPIVVVKPKAVVTSVVKPAAKPKPTTAPKASPKATPAVAAAKVVSAKKTITISSYVDAPGSQAAIDKCHLVLWFHHPLWLAGHNWCGFQWMAYVATGTTVRVKSGLAAGTYVVFGHLRLSSQGGAMPRTGADLVLQTCIGSGTGLTLLHRV